jgi:PAS domain S-box-containing protein
MYNKGDRQNHMKQKYGKIISIILVVMILTALGTSCTTNSDNAFGRHITESPFNSFRDIPGITEQEIADIEALLMEREYFTYGMFLSTEAFIQENGDFGGYAALFCQWLSDLFGIPFNIALFDSNDIINKLNDGVIDFSGNMMPTEERLLRYFMTDTIAERQFVTVRLAGSRSLAEIAQERLPRYAFSVNTPIEAAVASVVEADSYEAVWISDISEARSTLINGEADAAIQSSVAVMQFIGYDDIIIENFFPLVFNPITMAAADPALKPVISAVNKAIQNGARPYLAHLYSLGYQDYRKRTVSMLLSDEEREYIRNNPVIPVAAFNVNYPLSFWNARVNEWQGVFFDVMSEVSELTGISFEVAHDEHANMMVLNQMLEDREAYLIPNLTRTRAREEQFIWSEHPLMDEDYALISKLEFPALTLNDILHVRVGIARGTIHQTMFNQWFPNHADVVEFDGIDQALDALIENEVDVVMTGSNRVLHLTHFQEQPGYKLNLMFGQPVLLRITFIKEETLLHSIVDKALSIIDIDRVVNEWTHRTYDYRANIVEAQRPWLIGTIAMAFSLFILILVILIRNRKYTKEILMQRNLLRKTTKENELQLTKLEMAIKSTKLAVWDMHILSDNPVNPANRIDYTSDFRQILGYSDETDFPNVLGTWSNLLHPDDKERIVTAFSEHILDMTGETPFDTEYRMLNKDGEYIHVHATGTTIRDEDGNPLHVAGALSDITESKRVSEMERKRIEAESANIAKSEFLSHISHEIRTPMNAILGMTEIQLQQGFKSQEIEDAFKMIYSSGTLLLNIINDILDFSKIESGKLEIFPDRYDIPSLIYDTMQLSLLRHESRPVEFSLAIDENTPLDLFGDELRIKQVLSNIMSNAFKYTEEGSVNLSVSAEVSEEAPGSDPKARTKCVLILRISDTGQGMTEEQLETLYDEYTRFNVEMNRYIAGTGLGMSITKQLVEMMGGEIHVESEYSKGTRFTVRLPQERIGTAVCGAELADKLCNSRSKSLLEFNRTHFMHDYMPYGSVLIVDDIESNLHVAKGLMLPYGLKIETATSGFEAVGIVEHGNVYDIVFMDHMMPRMNGIEATKIMREMGYNNPVVALTANAVSGSAEIFLDSGFDAYISKPIDVRELNSLLNRFIRDKQPPEVVESMRLEMWQKKSAELPELAKRILSNERLTNAVIRDIENAISVLDELLLNQDNLSDSDMELYITIVHGMKSALANIGEAKLSSIAHEFEQAGKNRHMAAIISETPEFIESLRMVVEKIRPAE